MTKEEKELLLRTANWVLTLIHSQMVMPLPKDSPLRQSMEEMVKELADMIDKVREEK